MGEGYPPPSTRTFLPFLLPLCLGWKTSPFISNLARLTAMLVPMPNLLRGEGGRAMRGSGEGKGQTRAVRGEAVRGEAVRGEAVRGEGARILPHLRQATFHAPLFPGGQEAGMAYMVMTVDVIYAPRRLAPPPVTSLLPSSQAHT